MSYYSMKSTFMLLSVFERVNDMADYAFQSMTFTQRFFGHLKTVCKHKYYVARGCFRCGLYKQGLLHDLSKFSPAEFGIGIRYFDGHKSPNAVERSTHDGCSTSWLHHKGRNKHHFEYWIDFAFHQNKTVYGNKMPMKYLIEMVCDRLAACITYQGSNYTKASAWNHYYMHRQYIVMNNDTRAVLEKCLKLIRDEGEEACFKYMRSLLKITKGTDYSIESLGLEDPNVEFCYKYGEVNWTKFNQD